MVLRRFRSVGAQPQTAEYYRGCGQCKTTRGALRGILGHPLVLVTTARLNEKNVGKGCRVVSWLARRHDPECLSISRSDDTAMAQMGEVANRLSCRVDLLRGTMSLLWWLAVCRALASYMVRDEGARSPPNQGRYDVCGGWLAEWKKKYHVEGLMGCEGGENQSLCDDKVQPTVIIVHEDGGRNDDRGVPNRLRFHHSLCSVGWVFSR